MIIRAWTVQDFGLPRIVIQDTIIRVYMYIYMHIYIYIYRVEGYHMST